MGIGVVIKRLFITGVSPVAVDDAIGGFISYPTLAILVSKLETVVPPW